MGTLAKAYYITHIDGLKIDASSWVRPFDDLYDELNGNLDSGNIAPTWNFGVSRVLFSASVGNTATGEYFFSASTLSHHMLEVLPPGYNDIHMLAYGSKLSIFPGAIDVCGVMCKVSERIDLNITAITTFPSNSAISTDGLIGVIIKPALNITASDILLTNYTAATVFAEVLRDSLYRGDGRVVYTFIWKGDNKALDHEYLAPPIKGHNYKLTDSEALAHTIFATGYISGSSLSSGGVSSVIRYYNHSTYRYDWELEGRFPSSTSNLYILDKLETRASNRLIYQGGFFRGITSSFAFKGRAFRTDNAVQAEVKHTDSAMIMISNFVSNAVANGLFHLKFTTNSALDRKRNGNEGDPN